MGVSSNPDYYDQPRVPPEPMQQHLSLNPFASEFSSSDAWPNTMPMEFYDALH